MSPPGSMGYTPPMRTAITLILGCSVFMACVASHAQDPAIPRPAIPYDTLEKLHVRLGVQAYTFRDLSTFETIDVLKAMGLRCIELYPGQRLAPDQPDSVQTGATLSDENIQLLLRKLASAGVTATSFGVTPLTADEKTARKTFEFAKKMGLETIVSEPTLDKATWDLLGKLADEYQINIAVHNHPVPSTYWDPKIVKAAITGRSARLGDCADVGHWSRSGLTPVDCLKLLDGRIIEVHLKDVSTSDTTAGDLPWGAGVVNAPGIMAEMRRQGRNTLYVIEYESSTGQALLDNVAKCCEAFGRMAEELAGKP
jgi:sugar phosphate isomerase/epimerase